MPDAYDAARNPDMALEVLRQAQEVVRFKIQSAVALTAKITALFGQAILLSVAAFSAAAVAEAKDSWMPAWAAVGLTIAGLGWGSTAGFALLGLRPRSLRCASFPPDEMLDPAILNPPSNARGYAYIADQLQPLIVLNDKEVENLASSFRAVQLGFACSLLFGIVAAGIAAAVMWRP